MGPSTRSRRPCRWWPPGPAGRLGSWTASAGPATGCRDADVVLAAHLETIGAAVMEAAPRLRLVVVPFVGTHRIDVAAATRLGVLVANSPARELILAPPARLVNPEAASRWRARFPGP